MNREPFNWAVVEWGFELRSVCPQSFCLCYKARIPKLDLTEVTKPLQI